MSARAAVLQVLTVPGYGLELSERVRCRSGGVVRLRIGSLYPALRGLERDGLVRRCRTVIGARGRPRLYYELSVQGARAAMALRDALLDLLRAEEAGSPTAEEVDAMRRRLESCSDLSMAVLALRRRVQDATSKR